MAMTTIDELLAYLEKTTQRIALVNQSPHGASAESFAAMMWKDFTPHALALWTTPGVLEHIAACLSPTEDEAEEGDDPADVA